MANVFAGSEVVEMGVQIEKNGRDFYKALAALAKDGAARKLFSWLAGEEEKHITTYQAILDSVQKYEPQEAFTGEYFAYMKALADSHIFTRKDQGRKAAKAAQGDRQALKMGIGFEKDSILFYEGMKTVVPPADRKVIDSLIAQEQSHLRQLSELKARVL